MRVLILVMNTDIGVERSLTGGGDEHLGGGVEW